MNLKRIMNIIIYVVIVLFLVIILSQIFGLNDLTEGLKNKKETITSDQVIMSGGAATGGGKTLSQYLDDKIKQILNMVFTETNSLKVELGKIKQQMEATE